MNPDLRKLYIKVLKKGYVPIQVVRLNTGSVLIKVKRQNLGLDYYRGVTEVVILRPRKRNEQRVV